MKIVYITILVCLFTLNIAQAQNSDSKKIEKLERELNEYFTTYKAHNTKLECAPKMLKYTINDTDKTLTIIVNEVFSQQDFSSKIVEKIYKKINKKIPHPYDEYKIKIYTNGIALEDLIPNHLAENADKSRLWGKIDYNGKPWVQNISKPNNITHGLQNRHVSVWASHGRYYDQGKSIWKWQRPNLFGTTEDLFTQTIVVPYLIPMLENAGAIVFTPRERDWQKSEIIVDNDGSYGNSIYKEFGESKKWSSVSQGFAQHNGLYTDRENPFTSGTTRMISTSSSKKNVSGINYQPDFIKAGKYAVYVSYQTMPNSIDDAQYTVYHKGQKTIFHVNQKIGGGTWVYLGTFDFGNGCTQDNCVVLTNVSRRNGVVTGDAVRFGGGMGNITRGGTTSGLPRCLEGARYYAQWAGAPSNVVSFSNGTNDYNDDINARSLMTNWLAGGSCFVPNTEGKKVPIELSLAVHSDAGIDKDGGVYGTLAICTTKNEDKTTFNSGLSRMASRDFADALLSNVYQDIQSKFKNWTRRSLWDRNYSETRRPEVPSAILETMSHQNFTDMRYGLDPNFRFIFARSIYKTILKYISGQHGQTYVVQPLQPNNFHIEFTTKNKVTLRWSPVNDAQEITARPTSFNVYMAIGSDGFDNGTQTSEPNYSIDLQPGLLYRFKVTACNRGGESFPTEELCAVYQPNANKTILIVNGFHRLASPAIINNETQQGFDLNMDPGVTYGPTAGWNGQQLCFDRLQAGKEGPGALGYGGDELAGKFIAGNDFNYVTTHAEAIQTAKLYNIVSCSNVAIETSKVDLNKYNCVDLILGLEKDDGYSLYYYKTFSPIMRRKLTDYIQRNGRLFVSGSYIGTDMKENSEQEFLSSVFKVKYGGSCNAENMISGLGLNFNIYNSLNEEHYAAVTSDVLHPLESAYCAMQYSDGQDAGIAYNGTDYKAFTMGFPFECITDAHSRSTIMRGIMAFLLK